MVISGDQARQDFEPSAPHYNLFVLPTPRFYFPLRHGRYDVAPGLVKFGKDLGGGDADTVVFQIDNTFDQFIAAKRAARHRAFEHHVLAHRMELDVAASVTSFIVDRLVTEHPAHFRVERDDGADVKILHCRLTNETIRLSRNMRLAGHGRYADALDALGCQVQEDLAIVSTSGQGEHWLSFAHVCLPNGWAPEEKIGRSFATIHEPVAGMSAMNARQDEFANIMVNATDGLVRFAWGVTFDDELNHHPRRPRPPFDPQRPRAFLRVERQTIWGFPHVGAALFTIRTYFYNCDLLRRDPATREPLVSALRTMPDASRQYKGLRDANAVIAWLEASR